MRLYKVSTFAWVLLVSLALSSINLGCANAQAADGTEQPALDAPTNFEPQKGPAKVGDRG